MYVMIKYTVIFIMIHYHRALRMRKGPAIYYVRVKYFSIYLQNHNLFVTNMQLPLINQTGECTLFSFNNIVYSRVYIHHLEDVVQYFIQGHALLVLSCQLQLTVMYVEERGHVFTSMLCSFLLAGGQGGQMYMQVITNESYQLVQRFHCLLLAILLYRYLGFEDIDTNMCLWTVMFCIYNLRFLFSLIL